MDAVSRLLGGAPIDGYAALNMDGIALFNDAIGGVTVTITSDFTAVDPTLVEGETITLNGQQAFEFVRTRKDVDDQTNLARMERQRIYLEAMKPQLLALSNEEVVQVMDAVNDYLVTKHRQPDRPGPGGKAAELSGPAGTDHRRDQHHRRRTCGLYPGRGQPAAGDPAAVLSRKNNLTTGGTMERQNETQTRPGQMPLAVREQQEDEIDLVELFYLLWGHALQIIACIILGGAAAFAYTYFLVTPLYQATAKMYVASATYNSIVDIYDMQLGSQLALDYQQLLLSRPLMEDVVGALELDAEPEAVTSLVSINNPTDTRILEITVTCPDPVLAADLANEIAYQASVHLPRIMESPAPNIYEDALVPEQKSSPSYTRNTLLGAILAAAACCGFLVVRYLMDDSFVTPEDISRYFGVQPLAVIPEGSFGAGRSRHTQEKARNRAKPTDAGAKA